MSSARRAAVCSPTAAYRYLGLAAPPPAPPQLDLLAGADDKRRTRRECTTLPLRQGASSTACIASRSASITRTPMPRGIVYYANYLKFAERARTEMLRCCGYRPGTAARARPASSWSCAAPTVDFLAPARLDDELVVAHPARRPWRRDARSRPGGLARRSPRWCGSTSASPASAPAGARPACRPPSLRRSPPFPLKEPRMDNAHAH